MTKVAVIGAGLIGRAWSIVFARSGFQVALWDKFPHQIPAAMEFIADRLPELYQAGLIQDEPETVLARITPHQSMWEAVKDVVHVQEAVLLISDVDERGFKPRDDIFDLRLVDVADDAAVLFPLDEQLSELIVLENGDTRFVAIRGDDHFLVHGTLWRKVSASVRKPAHPHVEDQPEPG